MSSSRAAPMPAGYYDDEEEEEDEFDFGGREDEDGQDAGGGGGGEKVGRRAREDWRERAYGEDAEEGVAGGMPAQEEDRGEAFREAVLSGDADRVERALEEDASLMEEELAGMGGGRPVSVACREGHPGVVRVLLSRGASVAPDPDGFTPLLALCAAARREGEESESALLECARALFRLRGREVDVNHLQCQQTSALMFCGRAGHSGLARLLLERGARRDDRDSQRWTALCFAADAGRGEVAR